MTLKANLTALLPFALLSLGGCQTTAVSPKPQQAESGRAEIPSRSVVVRPLDAEIEPVIPPEPAHVPDPLPQNADLPRPAEAKSSPYDLPEADSSAGSETSNDPLTTVLPELPVPDPIKVPAAIPPPSPVRALFAQPAPPAVTALEKGIAQKIGQRSYLEAIADIERAIRIQPKNPELWHALALSRLRLGESELAEDLAKKSNSFAKSDVELTRANWRLIAESRQKRGDGVGAQQARERAW